MLEASRYFGRVGIGATSPLLFRANDKKIYVVKVQNNPLGLKVLVNELLAVKIGTILGLCFPNGGIIHIDQQVLNNSQRLRSLGVNSGLHFACQFLNHTEYVRHSNLDKAVNKSEMAGIILFDHMFYNMDRTWNRKNLLLRREEMGYKIYAIDNSHLFLHGRWTIQLLNLLANKIRVNYQRAFGRLLTKHLLIKDFIPYIDKVKQISNDDITKIVNEIPHEWLPDEAEQNMLSSYIRIRCDMAEQIGRKIFEYIPKSRREDY